MLSGEGRAAMIGLERDFALAALAELARRLKLAVRWLLWGLAELARGAWSR
jgi:hypothetical protein